MGRPLRWYGKIDLFNQSVLLTLWIRSRSILGGFGPQLFPRSAIPSMPKVLVHGRSIFYKAAGHGPGALVFLSGLGADHRAFARFQREFEAEFRVFTFDMRDVGQSDRVPAAYTTADMADDVAAWLEQVAALPAHLVGHSLGGLVAQEVALRHPERVKSLVLVSTHCAANDWRKALLESWVVLRQQLPIGPFTRAVLPWLVAPPLYRHPTQIEGLIQFAERNPWPQESAAFARQAQAAIRHDTRERLDQIGLPCLVLVGERDIVNPLAASAELADRLRSVRLVTLPEVGHLPHVEDPNGFRLAIESFLADQND
jgi:3-oxoadipate enol-lactonase